MMKNTTRPRWPLLVAIAGSALLGACGDARVKELSAGIPRDSLMKILGSGAPAGDSLPHVYRQERFLSNGQMLEILYYTNSDRKEGADTVPEAELTPLVLRSDTLLGWGWTYYDSLAADHKLQKRPR